jgi:glycerophosphoryl diester phosphodiesterase
VPLARTGRGRHSGKVTAALATEIAGYARGVGPAKGMLSSADDVAILHKAGLLIHPYTFRGTTSANARKPLDEVQSNGQTLRQAFNADLQRYIAFGIDGGFTDYPALWTETVVAGSRTGRAR